MDRKARAQGPPPSFRHVPDRRPPMYRFGGQEARSSDNSYRPSEFSYRPQYMNGPKFPEASRPRPLPNPRPSPVTRAPKDRRHQTRQGQRGRDKAQGRHSNGAFRGGKPATADRPLLVVKRSSTPEQFLGMATETDSRYKLADEDDQEVQGSSDDASGDQPHAKRAKFSSTDDASDCNNAPKWSNPDPYTVLPPVEVSDRKKKDVVKLIRSARISSVKTGKSAALANEDDFISFDTEVVSVNGHGEDVDDPDSTFRHSNEALTGQRADQSGAPGTTATYLAPGTEYATTRLAEIGPPPGLNLGSLPALGRHLTSFGPDSKPLTDAMQALQDLAGSPQMDTGKASKKRRRQFEDGVHILKEWQAISGVNATPWLTIDHSNTVEVSTRLHKEICDFYEFVRPQESEHSLRQELVTRVSRFLSRYYHNCEVQCFGSFAAGLYLPNADMDLVVLSDEFKRRRIPGLPTRNPQLKNFLFRFADQLQANGIARKGSTVSIFKARVPIVKYIDKITGLRVDISFENDTGPVATKTYQRWKSDYPVMPVIVSLIKQLLMMRGLNEVHTGGLGGFSVTCLVVSLLQNLPQVQSRAMDPMKNMGEIFMNFLDFYGNKFNTTTTGIQLEPAKFFQKHLETRVAYNPNKPWSLSILDPNQYNNDIASGSYNVRKIFSTFSEAYETIQRHMSDIDKGITSRFCSLLGPLYRGNYMSFERQRAHMNSLYTRASLSQFLSTADDAIYSTWRSRVGVIQSIEQTDCAPARVTRSSSAFHKKKKKKHQITNV